MIESFAYENHLGTGSFDSYERMIQLSMLSKRVIFLSINLISILHRSGFVQKTILFVMSISFSYLKFLRTTLYTIIGGSRRMFLTVLEEHRDWKYCIGWRKKCHTVIHSLKTNGTNSSRK